LKIALLGDIALFGKYSVTNKEVYKYFHNVAEKLREFDYVVGNLETPLCNSCKSKGFKSAFIKSDEENIALLKFLNINVVNLSNNHIFDYGIEGYTSTKKILEENDIDYFGIENKQLKINEQQNKIAFSGFCCYSTNGLGYYSPKTKVGVNILDAFEVEKVLTNNDREGYFNISSFHTGQEHVNYPNYNHVMMARAFAEKVPYVFYGHHPHVIQGIEKVKNSLIAYSLGNFCFDDVYTDKSSVPLINQTDENKKSFILSLEINNNQLIRYDIIPIYAATNIMNVGIDKNILEELQSHTEFLYADKNEYLYKRRELISNYIEKRKKKRDLNWYLRRLNLNSVGIIMSAKKNQANYKSCVIDYLNQLK
jgi:poly-gamma-glutamate synthesis protein (capsule biosynthesis protein)